MSMRLKQGNYNISSTINTFWNVWIQILPSCWRNLEFSRLIKFCWKAQMKNNWSYAWTEIWRTWTYSVCFFAQCMFMVMKEHVSQDTHTTRKIQNNTNLIFKITLVIMEAWSEKSAVYYSCFSLRLFPWCISSSVSCSAASWSQKHLDRFHFSSCW